MNYDSEIQMYPDISLWLKSFLSSKLPHALVEVRDTHNSPLNEYITRHGLQEFFNSSLWQTYEINVDITAFIKSPKHQGLVFVECKIVPISLAHLSQLLGYSRIALPLYSYLISSASIGNALKALITRYDRTDVLEYYWAKGEQPRKMIIAEWDIESRSINLNTVLPPGSSGEV